MGYDRALYRKIRDKGQDYQHRRKVVEDMSDYGEEHRRILLDRYNAGSKPEYITPGKDVTDDRIVWPHYVKAMLKELEGA